MLKNTHTVRSGRFISESTIEDLKCIAYYYYYLLLLVDCITRIYTYIQNTVPFKVGLGCVKIIITFFHYNFFIGQHRMCRLKSWMKIFILLFWGGSLKRPIACNNGHANFDWRR